MSVDLLNFLESEEADYDTSRCALALTLARISTPTPPLSMEDSVPIVEALVDYTKAFFTKGQVN